MQRMIWGASTLAVVGALTLGTMSSVQAGASQPGASLRGKVLSVSDVPAGWSVGHTSKGTATDRGCFHAFSIKSPAGTRAKVAFTGASTTFLGETLATGHIEVTRWTDLTDQLKDCEPFTFTAKRKDRESVRRGHVVPQGREAVDGLRDDDHRDNADARRRRRPVQSREVRRTRRVRRTRDSRRDTGREVRRPGCRQGEREPWHDGDDDSCGHHDYYDYYDDCPANDDDLPANDGAATPDDGAPDDRTSSTADRGRLGL